MNIVETKDLSKFYTFDSRMRVEALRGVNVEIEEGEFVSFMGASGSGKSTLLNIIGCLDQPTSGSVFIEGTEVDYRNSSHLVRLHRQTIGFVFQAFNLISTMNALENVCYPMHFNRINRSQQKQRATELLDLVELGDRMSHLPSELSGGEQQRVAIARALANNPRLILADEPTGNLDSVTGKKITNLMKDINREQKISFVVATHSPEMARVADKVVKLSDGELTS
ncbi:ABC transporter ATP-binding protein [Methanosarcina sp.]|uniref:ABC transporter ATP-binding protein n=1 Tax=Methanosarcina sp. TaxID=2213 RepID=UPI002988952B|nr:ABC transporter ATP-binding protein [Methanosarcina sp.]MDW5549787.1 ABC transporter ATP-binding protein [Methanosarcina sp.]MDW5554862.1 ABC transporter ATP-binding protein [Methanosarcina sp.]MDW5557992.1 ABC transporter ATP-binding protein [Methanosarcina sp.]